MFGNFAFRREMMGVPVLASGQLKVGLPVCLPLLSVLLGAFFSTKTLLAFVDGQGCPVPTTALVPPSTSSAVRHSSRGPKKLYSCFFHHPTVPRPSQDTSFEPSTPSILPSSPICGSQTREFPATATTGC